MWATILALIWLHAFKMDAKEEWELLAAKAASWLRAQNGETFHKCRTAVSFFKCLLVNISCYPTLITIFVCFCVFKSSATCGTDCVDAGNALLGCSVQKDALGL